MLTRRHYRRPNPDRRRALELLAGSRYGHTKAILACVGFGFKTGKALSEQISSGFASRRSWTKSWTGAPSYVSPR
jgi:hypothetical protein